MHRYYNGYSRLFNITIAILCISIVFVSFQLFMKIIKLNKSDDMSYIQTNEGKTVSVFSEIKEKEEWENKYIESNINQFDTSEWFLNVIAKSNTYMEYFISMHLSNNKFNNIFFSDSFLNIINLDSYFKIHLPAIFNIMDSTFAFSDKYAKIENKEDENSPMVLEDLIFIEDPEESEKGEKIENNVNEEDITVSGLPEPSDVELVKVNTEKPYVLIYHTHGTEAFLPINENQFHTTERKYNVISIGEILSDKLKKAGHNVQHVDVYHDIPSYNESYYRSLTTAKDILSNNNNIKIIFDIHRDGVDENASYIDKAKKEAKVNIDGQDVATFSMVIGNENPNKEQLINFAKYIKLISDKMYPGLCKGIIIKPYGKFNQYLSDHYVLLEVGSNLNTVDEAKRSAELIGDVLNNVINHILE